MAEEDLPAFNVVKNQIRNMLGTKVISPINSSMPVIANQVQPVEPEAKTDALD